jgi:adenylate kinase family enzyme
MISVPKVESFCFLPDGCRGPDWRYNRFVSRPPARPLVILIGPPLSGKTTFVTPIQHRYGVPGISVEDLIKDHASELMKMHRGRTSMAEMRYDPAMSRYLRARLGGMDLGRGAALDGFPATQQQAGELAKMIQELHLECHSRSSLKSRMTSFESGPLRQAAKVTNRKS